MTFTDTERAQIRLYLGYPDVYLDANSRLESAMDIVGQSRPEVVTLVQGILAALAVVDTSLTASLTTAGLMQADEVKWYETGKGGGEIEVKRAEGKRLCSRLSIIFGTEIANDVFADSGFGGYGFTSKTSQYGGHFGLG